MTGTQNEPPQIDLQEVRVLRLRPGDILVLKAPADTTQQMFAELSQRMREEFPEHRTLVIVGVDLDVLRGEESA